MTDWERTTVFAMKLYYDGSEESIQRLLDYGLYIFQFTEGTYLMKKGQYETFRRIGEIDVGDTVYDIGGHYEIRKPSKGVD